MPRNLAEREGFEPPDSCPSTVFKTAAFDRSAISPYVIICKIVLPLQTAVLSGWISISANKTLFVTHLILANGRVVVNCFNCGRR